MKKIWKQTLSLLLAAAMVFGMIPAMAPSAEASVTGTRIPDGVYRIVNTVFTDMAWDVPGDTDGTILTLNKLDYTDKYQLFELKYLGEENGRPYYSIKSSASGRYLDADTNTAGGNARIMHIYGTDAAAACRQWYIEYNEDDLSYSVSNRDEPTRYAHKNSGNGAPEAGEKIHLWDGKGNTTSNEANARWKIIGLENGVYFFRSAKDNGFSLDVFGAATDAGATINLYDSNYSPAQAYTVRATSDGYYTITNLNSGRYLRATGANNGDKVDQGGLDFTDEATDYEKWAVRLNSDGTCTFLNKASGRALDVDAGEMERNRKIQVWEDNGTAAQKWDLKIYVNEMNANNQSLNGVIYNLDSDILVGSFDDTDVVTMPIKLYDYANDGMLFEYADWYSYAGKATDDSGKTWYGGNNLGFGLLRNSCYGYRYDMSKVGTIGANCYFNGDDILNSTNYPNVGKAYGPNGEYSGYGDNAALPHAVQANTFANSGYHGTVDYTKFAGRLGYTLYNKMYSPGLATVGLVEPGLVNGTPMYTQETVQYLARLLRAAVNIPESADGISNYNFVQGAKVWDANGNYVGNGGAYDLAGLIRLHIGSTSLVELPSSYTGGWSQYVKDHSSLIGMSLKEAIVNGKALNYLDTAFWMLNSLFTVDGFHEDYDDGYTDLVLTKAIRTDGREGYIFDAGFTTSSGTAAQTSSVVYSRRDGTIRNIAANGKMIYSYTKSGDGTTLNPFLPITGRNNADGQTKSPYANDAGTTNTNDGPDNYVNRDFNFVMRSEGQFVFQYDQNLFFDFEGDDDVYLFVNGQLVMDIGGGHGITPVTMRLNDYVDAARQAVANGSTNARDIALALEDGKTYNFDFFYMERHGFGANFRIFTNFKITAKVVNEKTGTQVDKDGNVVVIHSGDTVRPYTPMECVYVATNSETYALDRISMKDTALDGSLKGHTTVTIDAGGLSFVENGTDYSGYYCNKDGNPVTAKDVVIIIRDADGNQVGEPHTFASQEELGDFMKNNQLPAYHSYEVHGIYMRDPLDFTEQEAGTDNEIYTSSLYTSGYAIDTSKIVESISEFAIRTSVNPVVQDVKSGAQGGVEIPNNGIINTELLLAMTYQIQNNEDDTPLTNLVAIDRNANDPESMVNMLTIDKDGLHDVDAHYVNAKGDPLSDQDIVITWTDADGNTRTLAYDKASGKFVASWKDASNNPCSESFDSLGKFMETVVLYPGRTMTISGIYMKDVDELAENNTYASNLYTRGDAYKRPAKQSVADADYTVIIPGGTTYYQWRGHDLTVKLVDFVKDSQEMTDETSAVLQSTLKAFGIADSKTLLALLENGSIGLSAQVTDAKGNPVTNDGVAMTGGSLAINFADTGVHNENYVTVKLTYNNVTQTITIPAAVVTLDVKDKVVVLDYGLSVDLNTTVFDDSERGVLGEDHYRFEGISVSNPVAANGTISFKDNAEMLKTICNGEISGMYTITAVRDTSITANDGSFKGLTASDSSITSAAYTDAENQIFYVKDSTVKSLSKNVERSFTIEAVATNGTRPNQYYLKTAEGYLNADNTYASNKEAATVWFFNERSFGNYNIIGGGANDDAAGGTTTGTTISYSMQRAMSASESVYLAVRAWQNGTEPTSTNPGTVNVHTEVSMYEKLTIVPANVIYYEDDFPALHYLETKENTVTADGSSSSLKQSEDQTGVLGYDPIYENKPLASSGNSVHKLTIKDSNAVAAYFSFTGTGFELISRTDSEAKNVFYVEIFDDAGKSKALIPVIPQYKDQTNGDAVTMYQVPVIRVDNLDYGTYTVQIHGVPSLVMKDGQPVQIGKTEDGKPVYQTDPCTLYLDGFRVFNPLGTSSETDYYNSAYASEKNATMTELRDLILNGTAAAGKVQSDGKTLDLLSGTCVYTENHVGKTYMMDQYVGNEISNINDFLTVGPNNEVYLKHGEYIFLTVKDRGANATVQFSARLLGALNANGQYAEMTTGTAVLQYLTKSGAWADLTTLQQGTDLYYEVNLDNVWLDSNNHYQIALTVKTENVLVSLATLKYNGVTLNALNEAGAAVLYYNEQGVLIDPTLTETAQPATRGVANFAFMFNAMRCDIDEGDIVDTPVEGAISLKGRSLLFRDIIKMRFYFTLEGVDVTELNEENSGLLIWNASAYNSLPFHEAYNATYTAKGLTSSRNGWYAETEGVPAKNMADRIYVRAYVICDDGSVVYSEVVEYSPAMYCKTILGPDSTSDDEMKALAVALMNYGAAAQLKFDWNTETLMNEWLTEEQKAMNWSDSQLKALPTDTSKFRFDVNDTITYKGTSVTFEGALNQNYYFNIPADLTEGAEKVELLYWSESVYNQVDVLSLDNASVAAVTDGRGVVAGIAAKDLSEAYYVCIHIVKDGQDIFSGVTVGSAHDYAAKVLASSSTNDSMKTLAKAMVIYNLAAEAKLK